MKFFPDNFFITDPFIESGEFIFLLQKIIIVLLIGSLIGLEREHARTEGSKIFAGIRTYTLISLLGLISALVESFFGGFALIHFPHTGNGNVQTRN